MVLGSAGIFGGNERSVGVPALSTAQAKQTQGNTASTFSPLLADEMSATPPRRQNLAVIAKSVAASDTNTSLNLVNGLPPITTPTATPAAPTGTTATPTATTATATATPDPPATTIDLLKAALISAGVDISGMQFNEHQDLVTYPGGSYTNDLIDLQAGGHSHTYTTNLVALDPHVTVVEIQQLLAGNRG
jgi:hypothetical protein